MPKEEIVNSGAYLMDQMP